MLRKLVLPFGIIFVGVLAIVVLVTAKPTPIPQPIAQEPAVIKVTVAKAKQEAIRLSVRAQGTVRPKREIELVAQVAGRIVSVEPAFASGGFFGPDQVLVQIDDREYRAAALLAKAQLTEAEFRLAEERGLSLQARREWRDLGNATANDLFLRKPQLAAAEASVESARAAVAVAEMNLEFTQISLPFAGRIKHKYADVGQYVSVGASIATAYDATVVEVRLPLTEQQASLIDLPLTPGEDAVVGHPKVSLTGTVAGRLQQWQGRITRTDAFIDENSRMYFAVVEIQHPFAAKDRDGLPQVPLLPGAFVEAEIDGKLLDQVLQLPRSALFARDKLMTLDAQNKVTELRARVLRRAQDLVWVQAEVMDDTFVTLEKQSLTPPGTLVEPIWNGEPTLSSPGDRVTQAPQFQQQD